MQVDESANPGVDREEWMRRTGPLYPGLVALRLLTRLPVLRGADPNSEDTGRSAPWFPVVGSLVGGVVAGVALVVLEVELVPAIVAALVLAIAAVMTGGLHEAELARTADMLGANEDDYEDDYEIHAGRIGMYGILSVVTLFAVRWILLLGTDPAEWIGALVASQVTIRWSLLLLLKIGDQVGDQFTGRSLLIGGFSWAAFAVATAIALVVVTICGGGVGVISLLVAAIVAFFVGLFFQRRHGGMSSPTLGAASIVCELTVLVVFALGSPALTSPWAL